MVGVSCASLKTESCEVVRKGESLELEWHGAAGINGLCVLAFVRCVFPRWPNGRRSSRWRGRPSLSISAGFAFENLPPQHTGGDAAT